MELSITGDGYIKCVANSEEHILSEQITSINASNLSLPCMKDRYDNNVLFYHIGDNISLCEYIKSRVMDFEALKELVINLGNVFVKLEKSGLVNQKIIADIKYIYINPNTKQLKVMQCPIEEYIENSSYQKIVSSICHNIRSNKAYVAIGYILEEIRQENFNINSFIQRFDKLENITNPITTANKPIETKIVEKKIIVNKTSYAICTIFAIIFEIIGIMLIPYLFAEIAGLEELYANILASAVIAILTIITFIIIKVCTKNKNNEVVLPIDNQITVQNAGIEQPIREVSQKPATNNIMQNDIANVKNAEDFDKTGLLEEEVEINPLKRQEKYNKNMIPTAYLVEEETNKKNIIRKSRFLVGRSKECDLSINSTVISKNHAEIVYENNEFYVRDLESSNFTYLNKATIEPMELYKIEDGSRIGFGNIWFIFKTNS